MKETPCTPDFNWTEVAPNMTRMCLGLNAEIRTAMRHLLTGDGIKVSDGYCQVHFDQEMDRMDQEDWEDLKRA